MFLSTLIVLLCMSTYTEHVQCSPLTNGEVLDNDQNSPETLEEKLNDHQAIMEGDIVMPTDRNAVDSVWPGEDGKVSVPYEINPALAESTDRIEKAMEMLSEHTCVSFHKRTDEADYLFFSPSESCASFVGYQSGQQHLYVGPSCSVGNVAHEIMHALGFHHEHTRPDRQDHIRILEDNIQKGSHRNFVMREGKTFGIAYDVSSIMHYGSHFFSKNGLPTITSKDGDNMGQRSYMTISDMRRIRALYKCGEAEEKMTVKKEWTPSLVNLLNKFRRVKDELLRIPMDDAN